MVELHAAGIEWAWVAFGIGGVTASAMLFRTALIVQTRIVHDENATQPERIIAAAVSRQEALSLGKQMLILTGGLISLFLAPPPPDVFDVPQTAVGILTLIGVSVLLTLTSILERKAQRQVALTAHKRRRDDA